MADDTRSLVNETDDADSDIPVIDVTEEQSLNKNYSNTGFIENDTEKNPVPNVEILPPKSSGLGVPDKQPTTSLNDSAQETNEKCQVTVEPIIFLTMLGISFQMVTSTNILINRICTIKFNYSQEICKNYTNNEYIDNLVQSAAADYGMYKSLIETIPAVFFSLFLGSWSDRHGRRFPIMSPQIGYILSTVILLVISCFDTIPPEYILLSQVSIGLSGGMVSFILGTFSYVSDITTRLNRTKRIAIADIFLFVAMPIGMLLSGILYKYWGFIPVYAASLGIFLVSLLFSFFFLPETIIPDPENKKNIIRDLFNIENLKSNLIFFCQKRKDYDRAYIILVIISFNIFLIPIMGEAAVMLLFVSRQFDWDQSTLSYYSSYSVLITSVGITLIFRFILKRWKVHDILLALMSTSGVIIKNVIIAFSSVGWMMYLGATVTFFQFIAMPVMRAFLSKMTAADEQGKLFAVIASGESIVPVFTSIVYSQVYKLTEKNFPGAVFLMSAGFMIIPVINFSCILFLERKKQNEKESNEDEEKKSVISENFEKNFEQRGKCE